MNEWILFRKKQIVLASVGLVFLFIVIYLLTHSFVTITTGSGEEKYIYIRKDGQDNNSHEFKLGGGSKSFILAKGAYTIGVRANDKVSMYERRFGGLTKNKVQVELKPQRQSAALGISPMSCAVASENYVEIAYYPCNPSVGDDIWELKSGNTKETKLRSPLPTGSATEPENDTPVDAGSITLPYANSFIKAASEDKNLYLAELPLFKNLDSVDSKKIEGIGDNVDGDNLSTTSGDGQILSYFNRENKSLFVFKKDLTNYETINLSDYFPDLNQMQVARLHVSNNSIYISILRSSETPEDESEVKTLGKDLADQLKRAGEEQKVIQVQLNTKEVKIHKLSEKLLVKKISVGSEGDVAIFPFAAKNTKVVFISQGKLYDSPLSSDGLSEACWQGTDLYYSTALGNQLFRYSKGDSASFLVYDNQPGIIKNLSCNFGLVSFTLETNRDGLIDEYAHYSLSDKEYTGARLESVLPVYIDLPGSVVAKISHDRNIAIVTLLQNAANAPVKETVKEKVLSALRGKNVSTDNLEVLFAY